MRVWLAEQMDWMNDVFNANESLSVLVVLYSLI